MRLLLPYSIPLSCVPFCSGMVKEMRDSNTLFPLTRLVVCGVPIWIVLLLHDRRRIPLHRHLLTVRRVEHALGSTTPLLESSADSLVLLPVVHIRMRVGKLLHLLVSLLVS